jgi:hypothetical protein
MQYCAVLGDSNRQYANDFQLDNDNLATTS